MIIEIGNKKLAHIHAENIRQIVMMIGACSSMEFWNEPQILTFENDLFSDTVVLTYKSFRAEDNKEGQTYCFFFNFKELNWHYTKDYERLQVQHNHHRRCADYKVIKYLISEGFDVPIY